MAIPQTTCPRCQRLIVGYAAVCPHCEAALEGRLPEGSRVYPSTSAGPSSTMVHGRRSGGRTALLVLAALGVGGVAFLGLGIIGFAQFFCLDFGDSGSCADEEADARTYLWLVMIPGSLAAGTLTYLGLRRMMRRRNERKEFRSQASWP